MAPRARGPQTRHRPSRLGTRPARPPGGPRSYLVPRPGLPHLGQRRPAGCGSPRGWALSLAKTARGSPLPVPSSGSRRGARPRAWPQQPPQTLWAAAAAPASELRPPPAPHPPAPAGSASAEPRSPPSPSRRPSNPAPRAAPIPSPSAQPDRAELTPPEPCAQGASSLPRGPRVGSGPGGLRAPRSGPLLSSARSAAPGVPGPGTPHPGARTRGRRHPLPSS